MKGPNSIIIQIPLNSVSPISMFSYPPTPAVFLMQQQDIWSEPIWFWFDLIMSEPEFDNMLTYSGCSG